jgi:signal transduction histidine kinase
MASLGLLAAGVAHEINNPLGFIMSNFSVLQMYLKVYQGVFGTADRVFASLRADATEQTLKLIDEFYEFGRKENVEAVTKDMTPLLDQTLGGLERVKKIVLDLKTFAHADSDILMEADVNQVMDNAINICWNELKYKVELTKKYGQLPLLKCGEQKLEQVFINILVNAAHAIEERGTLQVATFVEHDMICVQITDSGKGISPEHINKIFDPFFTTKPIGKGTGLGLSVSYDIVKQHEGNILVKSELGRGTTFTIQLPLKRDPGPTVKG